MRVLLTLFVCLAETTFLVYATDDLSVARNRTDVSTKQVVDEEDTERMMRIPLDLSVEGYLRNNLSPYEVFRKLGIPTNEKVFGDARLEVLSQYIEQYNLRNSGDLSLLKVLSSVMSGEDKLYRSITVAKANAFFRENALDLEKLLIAKWKGEPNLNPDFLLRRLEIKQSLDSLTSLEPVTKYITHYNLKNMNKQFSLVEWFAQSIDEDVLAVGLSKAQKARDTKEIATVLQQEQLNGWLARKKSVGDVFALLKLKFEGPNIFGSTKMEILNMYMEKYNVQRARLKKDPVTMIDVLLEAFGESNLGLLLLNALETGSSENVKRRFEVIGHLQALFSRLYDTGLDPSRFKKELYYEEDMNISNQVENLLKMYKDFYDKKGK